MSVTKRLVALTAALVAGAALALGVTAASAQAAPYTNPPTVSAGTQTPAVGGTVTVSGSGFAPNETIALTLHTAVYNLGSTTADSSGSFSATVQLPAGVSGQHTLVATGTVSGVSASFTLNIGGAAAGGGSASGGGGGGLSNTGVAVIGIGALGLVLLVGGGLMLYAGRRRTARI